MVSVADVPPTLNAPETMLAVVLPLLTNVSSKASLSATIGFEISRPTTNV